MRNYVVKETNKNMPIGIVQYYEKEKGYGYIRVQESKEEFYVKQKDLQQMIKRGDLVSFDLKEDRHGVYASDVKIIQKNS